MSFLRDLAEGVLLKNGINQEKGRYGLGKTLDLTHKSGERQSWDGRPGHPKNDGS